MADLGRCRFCGRLVPEGRSATCSTGCASGWALFCAPSEPKRVREHDHDDHHDGTLPFDDH